MELLADWFAAERAYDGKWPSGRWTWVEKRYKQITRGMHPINVQFLSGLLSVFGFEHSVMLSLTDDANAKFDWEAGAKMVGEHDMALKGRFITLWKHYDKIVKKIN